MRSQRGYSIVVLSIIVGLLILGIAGYHLYSQKSINPPSYSSPTNKPIPSSDPTANWKIYMNQKEKFSIKYHSKLIYKEYQPLDNKDGALIVDFTNPENPSEFPNLLKIRIFNGAKIQTDEMRQYFTVQGTTWKDIKIGGFTGSYIEASGGTLNGFAALLNQSGKLFYFHLADRENQKYISNKDFFQILSTFRFD